MANGYLHHNGTKFYPAPFFPVGSVYLSTIDINPSTYFGGTWVKVSGGYLYAADSSTGQTSYSGSGTQSKAAFTSGTSSTSDTGSTVLTTAQIPAHAHTVRPISSSNGSATWSGSGHYLYDSTNTWSNSRTHHLLSWPATGNTGGGEGHTHTMSHTHSIPAHSHTVASVYVFMYKRTA